MERLNVFEYVTRRQLWVASGAAALLLAACCAVSIYRSQSDHQSTVVAGSEINLLQGRSWDFAGVTRHADGLRVSSTGMAIVNQDGSPHQDNSPVNLAGTYLEIDGNFRVSATVNAAQGESELALYGQPPIISDESRADSHALKLALKPDNTLDVSLTNGDEKSGPVFEKTYKLPQKEKSLSVTRHNGKLVLAASGVELDAIAEHDLFNNRQVWFGFSAPQQGTSWVLNRLVAAPLPGGSLTAKKGIDLPSIRNDGQGLDLLARKKRPDFRIGGAFALGPLVSDREYAQLALGGNFGSMTPENAMKWQFVHPGPDVYTFQEADTLVDMARSRGLDVHGHALVFGEANPAWVRQLAREHPEQLEQVMVGHITTVVNHYKGRVKSWDVINEPLVEGNIWQEVMGPRYIEIALRAAHAADPQAELWINDYGMELGDEPFSKMLTLAKPLVEAGVPFTGVGFQSHLDDEDMRDDGRSIDAAKLKKHIEAFAALRKKVRISELDVSSDEQLTAMVQVVKTCFDAPNCPGVTFWGVGDKYSSAATVTGNMYIPGSGLPWDSKYRALPVVEQIRSMLGK